MIAIGGSQGAIEVLRTIMAGLPSDLPAAVAIVVHSSPDSPRLLAEILSRRGGPPVSYANDGEKIELGRVVIAPPNRHLEISPPNGGQAPCWQLTRGARENRHRPSIDPLMGSVALRIDGHSMGVILSGNLDDGAAGLFAIHTQGGRTIVQDPATAVSPSMPLAAMREFKPDWVLTPDAMAPKLVEWARTESLWRGEGHRVSNGDDPQPSGFTCPSCGGELMSRPSQPGMLRCRVGHAYGWATLAREYSNGVENALWVAMRTLREKSALARRLGKSSELEDAQRKYEEQAAASDAQADRIRDLIEHLTDLTHGTPAPSPVA